MIYPRLCDPPFAAMPGCRAALKSVAFIPNNATGLNLATPHAFSPAGYIETAPIDVRGYNVFTLSFVILVAGIVNAFYYPILPTDNVTPLPRVLIGQAVPPTLAHHFSFGATGNRADTDPFVFHTIVIRFEDNGAGSTLQTVYGLWLGTA